VQSRLIDWIGLAVTRLIYQKVREAGLCTDGSCSSAQPSQHSTAGPLPLLSLEPTVSLLLLYAKTNNVRHSKGAAHKSFRGNPVTTATLACVDIDVDMMQQKPSHRVRISKYSDTRPEQRPIVRSYLRGAGLRTTQTFTATSSWGRTPTGLVKACPSAGQRSRAGWWWWKSGTRGGRRCAAAAGRELSCTLHRAAAAAATR